MFLLSSDSFKINRIFQKHYQSVKRLTSRSRLTDLGPKCLTTKVDEPVYIPIGMCKAGDGWF